jgi:flagellar biosynthesis/type III secretory pathway chaperone
MACSPRTTQLLDNSPPPDTEPTLRGLLTALGEVLEQEYTALRQADAATVVSIAGRKRQLTDALANLSQPGVLATETFTPPEPLGELARRCHGLNRRNGELLHLQQSMLTRAMRVLSGSDAGPTVYGARGQTQTSPGGRHIASV